MAVNNCPYPLRIDISADRHLHFLPEGLHEQPYFQQEHPGYNLSVRIFMQQCLRSIPSAASPALRPQLRRNRLPVHTSCRQPYHAHADSGKAATDAGMPKQPPARVLAPTINGKKGAVRPMTRRLCRTVNLPPTANSRQPPAALYSRFLVGIRPLSWRFLP